MSRLNAPPVRATGRKSMVRATWRVVVVTLLLTSCAIGCGGGHDASGGAGEPREPRPGDSAFGTIGNVLVSDELSSDDSSVDVMWVGFNRPTEWADLMTLAAEHIGGTLFIGGRVVVDGTQPLGFRLDPGTTSVGEVVAEGIATTLDRIKAHPEAFAEQQPFGRWAFLVEIRRIAPSGR